MRTVTKRCFYIHIISSLHVPFLCLINLQCTRNISLSVKNTLLSMCPEFWGQPCWPIKRCGIPVGIFYCGWFFDTCQQHMSYYWNIKASQREPCSDSFIINYLPWWSRRQGKWGRCGINVDLVTEKWHRFTGRWTCIKISNKVILALAPMVLRMVVTLSSSSIKTLLMSFILWGWDVFFFTWKVFMKDEGD